MMKGISNYRVLYADTDKMGYLYYGHYAKLYEHGRSELIRSLDITYQQSEDEYHIMMPVLNLECRYLKPALYDELLVIHTEVREMPTRMIHFHHKVYNPAGDLLNRGNVKLFYVNMSTNKKVSCPPFLVDKFAPFF